MPRRLPEAPEGGVQAALCGKHRQGRWFESTIRIGIPGAKLQFPAPRLSAVGRRQDISGLVTPIGPGFDTEASIRPNGHMKQISIDREIRARIESFLAELSNLVKSSALEAVQSALGSSTPAAPAAAPAAAPRARPGKRGKRGKRSSDQVNAAAQSLLEYIQANPGQRLEQIGKGMKLPTKGLKLPIQKLIADKAISTEGQRRGTKYSAGAPKKGRGRARKA